MDASEPTPSSTTASSPGGAGDSTQFRDLVADLVARIQDGQGSLADLCREHPELLEEIRREVAALDSMERFLGEFSVTEPEERHRGSMRAAEKLVLPGYEIKDRLGRGGMGEVYLARDTELNRWVALKVIRPERDDAASRQRFRAEGQAAARLVHPHIVQVYKCDYFEGTPFLALEFCPRGNLARHLKGTVLPPKQAAELTEILARGIAYAHQQGVVHRDLKPANILLSPKPQGESPSTAGKAPSMLDGLVPKISDFGLARLEGSEQELTRTGMVQGTPSYMAPEQARGMKQALGPACDIWALGAMLYEFLSGRPPFQAATTLETLAQVCEADPVPLRRLQPGVPAALEIVCLKCLEKTPAKRYASAAELAEDLRRYREGQPILAKPAAWWEKAGAWVRRSPAKAASLVLAMCLVLTVLVGSWLYIGRLSDLLESKEKETQARAETATQRYYATLERIRKNALRPYPGWRETALKEVREIVGLPVAARKEAELRSLAAACLGMVDVQKTAEFHHPRLVGTIALHPGGRLLAVGELHREPLGPIRVHFLDAGTGNSLRTFDLEFRIPWEIRRGLADGISALAFSPDGKWCVALTRSGLMHRMEVDAEKNAVTTFAYDGDYCHHLHFSPAGNSLYLLGAGNRAERWSLGERWTRASQAADEAFNVVHLAEWNRAAVWRPGADEVAVYDAEMKIVRNLTAGTGSGLAALPDGRTLVRFDGPKIMFVDVELNETTAWLRAPGQENTGHPEGITRVVPSPDGRLLLSADGGDTPNFFLWEVGSGKLLAKITTKQGTRAACFSPDGRTLFLTSEKSVLRYEIQGLEEQTWGALQVRSLFDFALPDEGRVLATVTEAGTDSFFWSSWKASSNSPLPLCSCLLFQREAGHGLVQTFTREGPAFRHFNHFVFEGGNIGKHVELNTKATLGYIDRSRRRWLVHKEFLDVHAPESRDVLFRWVNTPPAEFNIWNTIRCLAVGESKVVVGSRSGHLAFLRAADAAQLSYHTIAASPINSAALPPEEDVAAVGDAEGRLHLVEVSTGKVHATAVSFPDNLAHLHFLGKDTLVGGSADGTVKLLRLRDMKPEELLTLEFPLPLVRLAVTPNGKSLAILLAGERGVRLWHLDRLEKGLEGMGLQAGLPKAPATRTVAGEKNGFVRQVMPYRQTTLPEDRLLGAFTERTIGPALEDTARANPRTVGPPCLLHRWSGWLRTDRPGKYVLRVQAQGGARVLWQTTAYLENWALPKSDRTFDLDLRHDGQPLRVDVYGFGIQPTLRMFLKAFGETEWRPLAEFEVLSNAVALPKNESRNPARSAASRIEETWRALLHGMTLEEARNKLETLALAGDQPCIEFLADPQNFARLAELRNLRELHLRWERKWTDADLAVLTSLPKLETLVLAGGGFEDRHLSRIRSIASLKMLHLVDTRISDAGLKSLNGHPNLRSLALPDQITPAGLARLDDLPKLTDLQIRGDEMTDAAIPLINRQFPKLTGLNLTETRISAQGLADLIHLETLESLSASRKTPVDPVVELVARCCPHLKQFAAINSAVTDRSLRFLGTSKHLQFLCLVECTGFTSDGFQALADLSGLRQLQLPSWTNDGCLKALAKSPAIESIMIYPAPEKTCLTLEGCRHLVAMKTLKNLELSLQKQIGADPAAWKILTGNPKLRRLVLSAPVQGDPRLTATPILEKLLPDLQKRSIPLEVRFE